MQWLMQKLVSLFWYAFFVCLGVVCGMTWMHSQHIQTVLRERVPQVREDDAQCLPPNAYNLVGLGNRWIQFNLDVNGERKTFLYHSPGSLTQVK